MGYWITPDGNYYEGAGPVAAGSAVCPPRPSPLHDWNGTAWVESLDRHKAAKQAELRAAYESAMLAGFTSSGLGTAHWYATDDDRKAVLAGAVVSGQSRNYGCYQADLNGQPVAGSFAMRMHTNAQLTQVLNDGALKAEQHLSNYLAKAGQASAATTVAQVSAVTW